jgi:HEAT repeat protein
MELAAMAVDRPLDRYLEQALHGAANALKDSWLPAVEKGEVTFDNSPRRLAFALQAIGSKDAAKPLFRLLASGGLSLADRESALEQIARLGGPEDHARLYNEDYEPALQAKVLNALARPDEELKPRPTVDLKRLQNWWNHPDDSVRLAALRLAGAWKLESFREPLAKLAAAPETTLHVREAAVAALVNLGGKASSDLLAQLAAPNHPHVIRLTAVAGLSEWTNAAIASFS